MRTSVLLVAVLLALPAAAQTTSRAPADALDAGDIVFGRLDLDSPFLDDNGARRYFQVYTYDAQPYERVTFSARSLDFVPAVLVADGPGLFDDRPNIELSPDGQAVTMDFYAPEAGTYSFAVVAAAPGEAPLPWTFQAALRATPPMDYGRAYPGGGDPGERYALLVGVNDYPSTDSDLNGTVNDVEKMRALLVDHFGYRPENVLVLTDADAERDHVIEAFRRHLGQAGPDGSALFYYSGHGTQIPDSYLGFTTDEGDAADEALVLWGLGGDFGLLIDEEVGALADNLQAGHRLVILDNCNSGTGTRGPDDAEKLYAVRNLVFESIADRARVPEALVREVQTTDAGPARHVLLAAARADQFSIETSGLSADGSSGGIFTYYLTDALWQADPSTPLSDVMAGVQADVMRTTVALEYAEQPEGQEPQAEGVQVNEPVRAFFVR